MRLRRNWRMSAPSENSRGDPADGGEQAWSSHTRAPWENRHLDERRRACAAVCRGRRQTPERGCGHQRENERRDE
jgi:hypothetical protein